MIRCVAIDDEPIAISILQEHCKRYGEIELKSFTSPILGMAYIQETHPDIVFLDIEMNSHNGLVMAKDLPDDICLIFTTAYANYALDGFNVDAVDFLHKPIFYPRFEKAIGKAKKYLQLSNVSPQKSISLKVGHKNIVVALTDIILIEAMDNYVKIYRKDLPTVVSHITMKDLESKLPSDTFVRIHRSFIVSTQYIEKFSNRTIYLNYYKHPVPVGRKYITIYNDIYHRFE